MKIESTRFGLIEIADQEIVHFPRGIIGFYDEREFAVVQHGQSQSIAWLQSANTPSLAFPVVSAHAFAPDYPDVSIPEAAARIQWKLSGDGYAVMVILSAPAGQPATVNLLAPVVVDVQERRGAQLILEGSRFSARELFVLPTALAASTAGTEIQQVHAG